MRQMHGQNARKFEFCKIFLSFIDGYIFTLDRQMRGDGHWTGQGLLLKCVLTLLNIGYFVIVRV